MRTQILITLILALFLGGCINDCKTDIECFKTSATTCSRTKITLEHEGSSIRITLRGVTSDNLCKTSLKIEKIGENFRKQYPKESEMLEGTTLNCQLPMNQEQVYDQIENIEENVDRRCTGPIKELIKGPIAEQIKEKLKA